MKLDKMKGEIEMASVFDVANLFIDICNNSTDDQITNLKLNKLLYYAQGCFLARTGRPLFDDSIEAWPYGPVVPSAYKKYKVCGRNPIPNTDDEYRSDAFSTEELDAMIDVMREFGKYTGSALVRMTHKSGTPWSMAHNAGETEISQKSMKEYFEKYPVPRGADALAKIPAVKKLPADWYDPSEDAEWEAYL